MNAADTASGMAVRLEDVVFSYGEEPMRFDVVFEAASTTALMGPSGSGKSTLLNLIAGFEMPLSGRILAGDRDITSLPPAHRPVSMIFQENNLFAHLDVAANVGLGISPALRLGQQDRARIA
ncbi:MAG: ATP-binding cassette domain-containing protein, partial [Bauldia sp.]